MQSNGEIKVGKVKKYDGHLGEIVTQDSKYYFTTNDICGNSNLLPNDLVLFKSKTEEDFPQAYFVKKIGIRKIK